MDNRDLDVTAVLPHVCIKSTPDCRTVRILYQNEEHTFSLTGTQASIFQILFDSWKCNLSDLGLEYSSARWFSV